MIIARVPKLSLRLLQHRPTARAVEYVRHRHHCSASGPVTLRTMAFCLHCASLRLPDMLDSTNTLTLTLTLTVSVTVTVTGHTSLTVTHQSQSQSQSWPSHTRTDERRKAFGRFHDNGQSHANAHKLEMTVAKSGASLRHTEKFCRVVQKLIVQTSRQPQLRPRHPSQIRQSRTK